VSVSPGAIAWSTTNQKEIDVVIPFLSSCFEKTSRPTSNCFYRLRIFSKPLSLSSMFRLSLRTTSLCCIYSNFYHMPIPTSVHTRYARSNIIDCNLLYIHTGHSTVTLKTPICGNATSYNANYIFFTPISAQRHYSSIQHLQ